MRKDVLEVIVSRTSRRRLVAGAALGAALGAFGVAGLEGTLTPLIAVPAALLAAGGLTGLWRDERRSAGDPSAMAPPATEAEVRWTRLGLATRLYVTPTTILVERFAHFISVPVDALVWAYPMQSGRRSSIPGLGAALMLTLRDGSEIVVRCRAAAITPALSGIRYFASHAALGWSEELAHSWAVDPAGFAAEVQARLGRVSGGGEA
jgi:hypothetical protein